jgi:hypothetical protein
VSFRKKISDNTRVRIFFWGYLTLGYVTKTLNQIIFFSPPKSEYFFQQHWESDIYLEKKNITPPGSYMVRPLGYFMYTFPRLIKFCLLDLKSSSNDLLCFVVILCFF